MEHCYNPRTTSRTVTQEFCRPLPQQNKFNWWELFKTTPKKPISSVLIQGNLLNFTKNINTLWHLTIADLLSPIVHFQMESINDSLPMRKEMKPKCRDISVSNWDTCLSSCSVSVILVYSWGKDKFLTLNSLWNLCILLIR